MPFPIVYLMFYHLIAITILLHILPMFPEFYVNHVVVTLKYTVSSL